MLRQRGASMLQLSERRVLRLQIQQGQLGGWVSFQRRLLGWGRRTSTDR
jgi:hypothetical protein